MNKNTLWSLRLGFSAQQANKIEKLGLQTFLKRSFKEKHTTQTPEFLKKLPTSIDELRMQRKKNKLSEMQKKAARKERREAFKNMKVWWVDQMREADFPLREKMVCFWHNHFVASAQKVKMPQWIFQHNMLLRQNAFGNFREITRLMVKSNAIINYLDNNANKVGAINENLSRELLELFTIGIGNYTEADIKNGAKALAGLSHGDVTGIYRPKWEDNSTKKFMGVKGNLKADDLIDIIFEQQETPYWITEKILKWFIYDNPPKNLVKKYGNYLREQNYEIQPLLQEIFATEYNKNTAGSKIKDPLTYIFQIIDELNASEVKNEQIAFFLKKQGMDLFEQPNVKGWEGGRGWLTSQVFLDRNKVAKILSRGQVPQLGTKRLMKGNKEIDIDLNWPPNTSSHEIIKELSSRLLFQTGENLQKEMESILGYDFDTNSENANKAVLRLFYHICQTPEFHIV